MREIPRGTVTFLFTDIEGSTRLLRQLRASYGRVLADHQRLLREAFARHGGAEIDTQGDAFFVAFHRASDAVEAAVDAQRAVFAHDWDEAGEVRVRMGIHTGHAAADDGRYVGLAVHRTARICAAAHGGQIALSQTSVNLLEDEEELRGIELRDLGPQRLKDFDRPVRVYQVETDGLPRAFPPLRSLDTEADDGQRGVAARIRRRPRAAALAGAAALALLAGVAAFVVSRVTGESAPPPVVVPSLVRINPRTSRIEDVVKTDAIAEQIVATSKTIWFLSSFERSSTLFRMDVETKEITPSGGIPAPCALTADPLGRIWIASCQGERSSVIRIDPDSGRRARTYPVRGNIGALAVDRGAIYVTLPADLQGVNGSVVRIPVRQGNRSSYRAGAAPFSIALTKEAVWVGNYESRSLTKIFLATGHVDPIETADGPLGMAVGAGGVWVSHFTDPVVYQFDPGSEHQESATRFPDHPPGAIAATNTNVWVAAPADAAVYRLKPPDGHIDKKISLGRGHWPSGIAATEDAVWVTATPPLPD